MESQRIITNGVRYSGGMVTNDALGMGNKKKVLKGKENGKGEDVSGFGAMLNDEIKKLKIE